MIFDRNNVFSVDQAITVTAVSTDVIDFGATMRPQHAANVLDRDLGMGTKPKIRVQVTTAFVGLTSLQVEVQTANQENFSDAVVTLTTAAIPLAQLVAGYVFPIDQMPIGMRGRYMRLRYVVAGTATAGTVFAGLVFDNDERVV